MLRSVMVAALAALPLTTPAWAGTPPSLTVQAADLDLTSANGKAVLAERVERAARRVCPAAGPNVREFSVMRACQRAALSSSAPSIAKVERLQRERRQILAAVQSATVSPRAAAE